MSNAAPPPDPTGRVAVALRYDAPNAPSVVASGRGHLAAAILAKAEEAGVPVDENPALAEALAALPVGDEIPVELYRAVAAVIGFVLQTAKQGDGGTKP
ncbi:EscU/YscU/HrcU family type III secretion system export apparatus switch protein [Mongoliimonas terrestris]|uniref:EscU/YscU/HrcU family type III secretion system export apparatus switch protein n=1 Tax=Mongoliimonas terrestris TaxID=1709001 RepID=UPI0009496C93|nr:EscU/YscU/HrcU family type III secretion system export apparatus switch protein [Mongoliimonas terrestris]